MEMPSRFTTAADATKQLNLLVDKLNRLTLGSGVVSRHHIRELWRTRQINDFVRTRQKHQGCDVVRRMLETTFQKDGNYEAVIDALVTKIGGWPDDEGNVTRLLPYENKITHTGGLML